MNRCLTYCITGFIFIGGCGPAYANVGVPMLVIAWPFFGVAFLPIVIIEWLTFKKWLSAYTKGHLFWASFFANLVSTILGIPLSWGLMVVVQMSVPGGGSPYPDLTPFWRFLLGVTVQSAWLIPYEQHLFWMIPTALLVLLVPFFYISYGLEAYIAAWYLRNDTENPQNIKKAVWKANINSYGMLAIFVFLYLIGVCFQHGSK